MSMKIGTTSSMIQNSNNINEARIESKPAQQTTADQSLSPRDSSQAATNLGQTERAHDLKLGEAIRQSELHSVSRTQTGKLSAAGSQVEGATRPGQGNSLLDPLGNRESVSDLSKTRSGGSHYHHSAAARDLMQQYDAPPDLAPTASPRPDGSTRLRTRWQTQGPDGSFRSHELTETLSGGRSQGFVYRGRGGGEGAVSVIDGPNGETYRSREVVVNGRRRVEGSEDGGETWFRARNSLTHTLPPKINVSESSDVHSQQGRES